MAVKAATLNPILRDPHHPPYSLRHPPANHASAGLTAKAATINTIRVQISQSLQALGTMKTGRAKLASKRMPPAKMHATVRFLGIIQALGTMKTGRANLAS
jgi:hypothetical protein